jgi:hypothetical protein
MSFANITTRANAPSTRALTIALRKHGKLESPPLRTRHQHFFYDSKQYTNVITDTFPCTHTYQAHSIQWPTTHRASGTLLTTNYSHILMLFIRSTYPGTFTVLDQRCILP